MGNEEYTEEVVLNKDLGFTRLEFNKFHYFNLKKEDIGESQRHDWSPETLKAAEWYFDRIGECYPDQSRFKSRNQTEILKRVISLTNNLLSWPCLSDKECELVESINFRRSCLHIYSYNLSLWGREVDNIDLRIPKRQSESLAVLYRLVMEKAFDYFLDETLGHERLFLAGSHGRLLDDDGKIGFVIDFFLEIIETWPGELPEEIRSLINWNATRNSGNDQYDHIWIGQKLEILEHARREEYGDWVRGTSYADLAEKDVVFGPKFYKKQILPILSDIIMGKAGKGAHKAGALALEYPQMFLPLPKKRARTVSSQEWEELYDTRPNFHEVTDYARSFVKRNELMGRPFRMPPILLDGPPGVGKTSYARKLAEILGLPSHLESAQNLSEGFDLSGSSAVYADSTPGMIFETLAQTRCRNLVFIFDEIDKISTAGIRGASVENTLLSLLERETSSKFVEQFFRTQMDASWINWIMTSNDAYLCPVHLRSRLKIFQIKKPNLDEIDDVIQSIYKSVIDEEDMASYFEPVLNEFAMQKLREMDLRDVKRRLEHGLNQCILEVSELSDNMAIKPSHLEEKKKKRNIFR